MPHTNNANLKASRKANRADPKKPKFLQKRSKKSLPPDLPPASATDDVTGASSTASSSRLPPSSPSSLPREHHSALIAEFHALEKRLHSTTDEEERKALLKKQEELGGLDAYQMASVHGGDKSRGGESGKWCVKMLKELKVGVNDKGKEQAKVVPEIKMVDGKEVKVYPKLAREKLRLLDVGAIGGTSFADWPWIQTTCIDLNPQAEHVIRCDFFDFPVPPKEELYDVVGLSLVVNFIGSLTKRGDVLRHAHQYLKATGLLYLVLPLSCVTNSRYLNHARLTSILKTTGWKSVKQHDSAKLTYWLLEKDGDGQGDATVWKREEVRGGVRRNNFCIIVRGKDGEGEEEEDVGVSAVTAEISKDNVNAEEEEWGGIVEEEEEWGGIDS